MHRVWGQSSCSHSRGTLQKMSACRCAVEGVEWRMVCRRPRTLLCLPAFAAWLSDNQGGIVYPLLGRSSRRSRLPALHSPTWSRRFAPTVD
jgi:hypothetical protein